MSSNPSPADKSVVSTDHIDDNAASLRSAGKTDVQVVNEAIASGAPVQMRSTLDNLPIHKAFRIFWRVAALCMLAAFASALEGYRTLITQPTSKGGVKDFSDVKYFRSYHADTQTPRQNTPSRHPSWQTRASFGRCPMAAPS